VATLTHPSIRELGRRLRARDVTAVELTRLAVDEIEEREPELNAFTTVLQEPAIAQARRVDEALARGEDPGPLAGIPVAVKDTFLVPGVPTTGGSSLFRDNTAVGEADVVARLRLAGAVLVGKTNMNEFGWGLDPRVGRVNNPLDTRLTAGGSSGGSAAAVASGSLAFAIGTDSGGSVRMPAAFCALVGLKPTHGLVPSGGKLPGCWSLNDSGPIARSVEDIRAVLSCLAATTSAANPPTPRPILGVLSGAVDACRPPVAGAVRRSLNALDDHDWNSTDVDLDLGGAHEAWMTTFAAETAQTLAPFLGARAADVSADLRDLLAVGAGITAAEYVEAQAYRSSLTAAFDAALRTVEAVVTPTVPSPPEEDDPDAEAEEYFGDMRWTILSNLTGHPAVTIPIPALPVPAGLQLIGRRGSDDALLVLAQRLEAQLSACNEKGDDV
jgi:aspartyl-tRNA(Asn)/glutamyl-tRNA(Gln) amidotransferase subunit A